MKIEEDKMVKSGYHLRPATPSAGWALSVLIAVCAGLWVWDQGPEWYWSGAADTEARQWLRKILHSYFTAGTLLAGSNLVVGRWVTRPLWRGLRAGETEDLKRIFVLVLAITFHLAFLLSILFVGLLALVFSGSRPMLSDL